MNTQADSVQACACALGKSLDGSGEPPSDEFPHGNSDTHIMLNVEPVKAERWDIYRWNGRWRTISSVLALSSGATAFYFRELPPAPLNPAIIPEGTHTVTIYRPKDSAHVVA